MLSPTQKRNSQKNRKLLLLVVCVLFVAGCTPTVLLSAVRLGSGGPTRIFIRESVIERLFARASAEMLHVENKRTYLSLYCQIAEGSMCYQVPYSAVETHTLLDIFLRGEANQIGRNLTANLFIGVSGADPWKYVEMAEFNAVRVRCHRPEVMVSPIQCWVGFGHGWEPALVF